MEKTTMNENQADYIMNGSVADIMYVLEKYVPRRNVKYVAQAVHSMAWNSVEGILRKNLENERDVRECLFKLMEMEDDFLTATRITRGIETIHVGGSDSNMYFELLKNRGDNIFARQFLNDLKVAIEEGEGGFDVPVCDMSISVKNGKRKMCFNSGSKPGVGLSFNELKQLAKENDITIGNKNQYVLFLATMICRLKAANWTQKNALCAICLDSTKIGHYQRSENAKNYLELTGSRRVAGKCDLGNTYKIFAADGKAGIAGGSYTCDGFFNPLADITIQDDCDIKFENGVGWVVL